MDLIPAADDATAVVIAKQFLALGVVVGPTSMQLGVDMVVMEAASMRRRALTLAVAIAVIGVSACTQAAKVATGAEAPAEATDLSAENFKKLSERVDQLEFADLVQKMEREAYIKTTAQEYATIRTELGYLALSVSDIKEYANGSQLVLTMGNPTSATLNDLSADLEWGRVDQDGVATGKAQTKSHTFDGSLPAGTWRRYTINLADISPKELGYIRVKNLEHKSISLRALN